MSKLPAERPSDELVVQESVLRPINPQDKPSRWKRFLNGLRTTIGLKPLYLAERFATAKVRKEEIDNDIKLVNAKLEFQKTMAEMRRLERESKSKSAETKAKTKKIQVETQIQEWALEQLKAKNLSPEEAANHLAEIIQKIELIHGGRVEIPLAQDPQDETPGQAVATHLAVSVGAPVAMTDFGVVADKLLGTTTMGKLVATSGQYAAASCCRILKAFQQGETFPACDNPQCANVGKSTRWELVPSGAAIGLKDAPPRVQDDPQAPR
jgi:hypothetical protein